MKLTENMLIKYDEKRIIRVLNYDSQNECLIVIDLYKNKWPYVVAFEEIIKDISEIRAEILERDIFNKGRDITLSDSDVNRRDLAWEVISYIFEDIKEPYIYFSKYRTLKIKETIDKFDVSFNTIKNYLISYWKGGKIRDSLLPGYCNCGGKGIEKKNGSEKRGRRRAYNESVGVNVDDNIKKMFKSGLNKYYYNNRQNSLQVSYELTIKDYFTKEYINKGNVKVPILEDSSKLPTYNQFYYWYKMYNNKKREIYLRNGERIFNQNYRSIIGNATSDGDLGPASLWQIDSTIADVYLVSSLDRNRVIGRPVLFLIIDVFSRTIVGLNVTLESFNSYIGAMMALINAMTPKTDYCKKYGVEINESDWPVSCVPQRILADRGELMGGQIENAIKNLGIIIQNTPPYRADYKGIVEQSFRGINLKLKPFIDGAVINGKNTRERGEKDYRLNANLTLREFTKIIIKCILFHNNHHVLSEYVTSEMMFQNNMEKIPIKIWEFGIQNQSGLLRTLPEEVIKMNLLPQGEASVTPKGVAFNKLLYASKFVLGDNWFQKARTNGNWKIKISYDPRDLTNIYFLDGTGQNFEKLTLLDYLSKYKELDSAELDEIYKYEKEIEVKSKDRELEKKIILFSEIEGLVQVARKASQLDKDSSNSTSKTQWLKGIGENNAMEKELLREAVVLGETIDIDVKDDACDSIRKNTSDELDLFRQIQMESCDDNNEK